MSRLTNIISIVSLALNVGLTSYTATKLYQASHRQPGTTTSVLPPQIEVRIADGKEPFIDTVTVCREVSFGGDQIAARFVSSIRGKSYVVQSTDRYYILYSPHLQQLLPGAKVSGWFVWTLCTSDQAEGKLPFMVPIELISAMETKAP